MLKPEITRHEFINLSQKDKDQYWPTQKKGIIFYMLKTHYALVDDLTYTPRTIPQRPIPSVTNNMNKLLGEQTYKTTFFQPQMSSLREQKELLAQDYAFLSGFLTKEPVKTSTASRNIWFFTEKLYNLVDCREQELKRKDEEIEQLKTYLRQRTEKHDDQLSENQILVEINNVLVADLANLKKQIKELKRTSKKSKTNKSIG